MSIGSLVVDLVMKTGSFETDTKRASKQAEKFAKDIDRQIAAASRAIALAATAAAAGMAAMVKSAIDAADEISKLSQSTGVATETLSQLKYSADLSGTSFEDLTKGLQRLSKSAADAANGLSTPKRAFEALGISATNADGSLKSTDDLLYEVADAFSQFEDGAGKAAVAQDLLGRSGANMIPFLNQGRAGIEALNREADTFGVTIGGKAGKAAEDFNDNITRLQTAFKGVANQVAQRVLPTLVAITDRFVDAAKNSDGLSEAVDQVVAGLKVLASAGIVIKTVFEAVGKTIGTVAGFFANLHLNPRDFVSPLSLMSALARNAKDSVDDLKGAFSDIGSSIKGNLDTLSDVWDEPKDKLEEVSVTAERLKQSLKFDDGSAAKASEAIAKAAEDALAKITDMTQGLRQQVDTFEQGETAVIRYRIAQGDLAEVFEKAGAAAEPYKRELIALTSQLELMQQASEGASDAISDFTEEVEQSLQENIGGMFTDLEQQLKKVASASEFEEQFKDATFDSVRTGISSALKDGAREGWEGFRDAALNALADIVATDFTKRLLDWVSTAVSAAGASGGGGGSSTAGWISAIASIFGGGRASGGPVDGGMLYRVNEKEPEFFRPNVGGKVIPLSKMGGSMGMSVTNNISVEAPNGRISMETQQQLLARMSQALMSAQRRNG